MSLITCTRCNALLPETTDFFHRNGGGLKGQCKACRKAVLKKEPFHPDTPRPGITDNMVTAALVLRATGHTDAWIANDLGVPQYAVRALFRVKA